MAFPTIEQVTATDISTASQTHSVTLPATIAAGDLVIIVGTSDNNTQVMTVPGTFTEIYNGDVGTNHIIGVAAALDALGTEDGSTVDFTLDGATTQKATYYSFLIPAAEWSGAIADVEGNISGQTGTGTDPDPPSVTASWGSTDNLWIACGHCDADAATSFSVYPEVDNNNSRFEGTTGGAGVAICTYDGAAAATRNPSAYTIDSADQRLGGTIVVRPAPEITSVSGDDVIGTTEDDWQILGSGFGAD